MKFVYHILLPALFPLCMNAQIQDIFDPAKQSQLPQHMSEQVYLEIPDFEGIVTGNKAAAFLKQFYETHKISAFKPIHSGSGKYLVGELRGYDGIYRLTYIRDKDKLKEIIIRPNDP